MIRFEKLLVANRGEIACRVFRTAKRLGIRTVAVASEADVGALHARLADETVMIGPAPARESYLRIDRILSAARETGAQAIHPGYGFLSENADFAQACEEAGLIFIGPPASAIRAMGSKANAKALMEQAGVRVVPGYHGADQDAARLGSEADKIGYPVLIKAASGGGGRGMRPVERPADFESALASARREAAAHFGDDRVLIESLVPHPRHIEVQIFADGAGRCVHLFERDCSLQRRHQKVIEEAPAPAISERLRAELTEAALRAARAARYVGAGTVEFIVDPDGRFYFMEMNTRLQVEHGVTERVTGVDLVEWQLRVAAGEPLPLEQKDIAISGHAVEARICAEDPSLDFRPAAGTLVHFELPAETADLRIDRGFEEGDAVSPHYDSLLAKVICHGADRAGAVAGLVEAMGRVRIAGIPTNVTFLRRLATSPAFAQAKLDTGIIGRDLARLSARIPPPAEACVAAAVALLLRESQAAAEAAAASEDSGSPWGAQDGWRLMGTAERTLVFTDGIKDFPVRATPAAGGWTIAFDGAAVPAKGELGPRHAVHVEYGDRRIDATVAPSGPDLWVLIPGEAHVLRGARPDLPAAEAQGRSGSLSAPMPGRIVALLAPVGSRVEEGAPLVVMESMKMELTIAAPFTGVLRAYRGAPGDVVAQGAPLAEVEAGPAA